VSDEQIPYRVDGTTPAAQVVAAHSDLEAGAETGTVVTVAGRVMLLRVQGRLAFAELRDWTGQIQLFALAAVTDRFEDFKRLNLGDWVTATGEVVRTRRGELSVKVASWILLAHARHGFGDKWKGIHDTDLRFRQREVDLWANEGVRERFLMRSRILRTIRELLERRGYVEVETPVLQPLYGGANAKPFVTHFNSMHSDFYLRIALELYLKRLVIGGFERVFEIGRIFRNEGVSPKYNPEFTMLEAYAAYADYFDMAELVEYITAGVAETVLGTLQVTFQGRALDLTPPWPRKTLVELVEEHSGLALDLTMGLDELRRRAESVGVEVDRYWDEGKIVSEIYEKTTEPNLWGPVHVMDYPESVSPLTRKHRSKAGFVERITPVLAGRELGECYSELVDPDDQRARFEAQALAAAHGDEEAMMLDEDFLRALERGLPPTGGIGLGVDRLVMLLTDSSHIREVLLFPALRPEPGPLGDSVPSDGAESARPEG
jgi:lysyl-tRNA synthetase class 2